MDWEENPWIVSEELIIMVLPFSSQTPSHPFSCLSVLHPSLLARFDVYRMLFDFFYDGFLLYSSLESFQSSFYRFTFVYDNKCQKIHLLISRYEIYNLFGFECQP